MIICSQHPSPAFRRITLSEVDVTLLLEEVQRGVPGATDRLASGVYDALHALASAALRREAAGHTLQPTELADEAFVKLVGQSRVTWESRSHFFGVAAGIIRRILIDHARRRSTQKRDHGVRVTFDESLDVAAGDGDRSLELLALDDALTRLEGLAPRQARVVELRFFGGLDVEETARALGTSPATVKRDWTFARAFLLDALAGDKS